MTRRHHRPLWPAALLGCAGTLLLPGPPASAAGLVFGLAGKSRDDANFVAAWRGCDQLARQHGDVCLNIGRAGAAQFRSQDAAILEALQKPLAGLAVSVTSSDYLGHSSLRAARERRVPVITFDSDLMPAEAAARRAYVGPDNLGLGRKLGEAVAARHPQGGTVCLMSSDPHDPNLNLRLAGVRQALSKRAYWPASQRLKGESGWREADRCPWYSGDMPARALRQMRIALAEMKVDAFVAVGGWPLADVAQYRATIGPLREALASAGQTIAVGIGQPTALHADLLRQGLVHVFVSIDFAEMGRTAYWTMKALSMGSQVKPLIAIDTRLLTDPADVSPAGRGGAR